MKTHANPKIKIAICGYGNLGKGVESEIKHFTDYELVAIFTRRRDANGKPTLNIASDVPVVHVDDAASWKDKIDVMILCGGSKDDLPVQTPHFSTMFNCVDSFDTHAQILKHLKAVDDACKKNNTTSIISIGWDPGFFSLARLYMSAAIPQGKTYSFWGKGVSQGHSDAVRRVEGVENGIQYTIPNPDALAQVRDGKNPDLTTRQKHTRVCYVVAKDGADRNAITTTIQTMPDYFSDYDTTVHFITSEELAKNHASLPHGGNVIHSGITGENSKQTIEFSLQLDSNPQFTASVLLAYARAAYRLAAQKQIGAKTVFDIPPIMICSDSPEDTISKLL